VGGRDQRGQIVRLGSISERARNIEKRRQIGHCACDALIGKSHKHANLSLVEHKSGYAVLAKAESKTAGIFSTATIKRLKPMAKRVQSFTHDNGKEFAYHAVIDHAFESISYFADPYWRW